MLIKFLASHKSLGLSIKLRKHSASKRAKISVQEMHSALRTRGKNVLIT